MAASMRPLGLCRALSVNALFTQCSRAYTALPRANTTSQQHLHLWQPQHRSYATTKVTKKPQLHSKSKTWGPIDIEGLTVRDFLEVDLRAVEGYFRHAREQYFECLQKFSSTASGGDQRWVYRLSERERPSVQLIHETACILREMPWIQMAPLWSLGLWAGAAELGHLPSLLSLRRYLLHSKALEELPLFKPAQALFRSHVVAAKDPNVLTLEGESLAIQGKPNAAIRVLTLALEMKGDQGFEWKGHCERLLGESYVKIGQKELGCEYLRAAVSKGYVVAELALAEATDDAEEAMKYTYRTACVNQELFGRVAHLELARAGGPDKSSKPKREAEKWALEWSRLADPAASY